MITFSSIRHYGLRCLVALAGCVVTEASASAQDLLAAILPVQYAEVVPGHSIQDAPLAQHFEDDFLTPPPADYLPPQCSHCGRNIEQEIQTYRRSFYQGSEVLGAYFGDLGDELGGLDVTYEEVRSSFAVPIDGLDHYIGIRPFFRATHLNGPTAFDVPETLYSTGVSFLHQKQWHKNWSSTIVVSPSVRSDFSTSSEAFRVFGLAVANWQYSEALRLSLGVVFFDREDVGLLPAAGLVWQPRPDFKVDATVPRPRIAKRLWKNGRQAEGWAYIGGSFGGGSWSVTRDDQSIDELTLRDFQLSGGYEVISHGNRGFYLEGGYSFAREIEYQNSNIDEELDDALFIQGSWRF